MFGLDFIKIAVVGGLVLSAAGAGYAVYHGIQAAEASKIELQQVKLVAAAQHAQDLRSLAALQDTAAEAVALAAQAAALKEQLHAATTSRACLASPAGRAFSNWLHDLSRVPGPAPKAAAGPVAVPGPAAGSR